MTGDGEAPKGKQKGARKPKGAANREGRPWKRPDGRWTQRVWPPEGVLEKRPKYVYGKTRAECKRKHDERVAEQARGLPDRDKDVLIGDYLHKWLYETLPQYVAAGKMQETTMYSYQENAGLHIIPGPRKGAPTLRGTGLLELTVAMAREWQDGLLKKPSGRQRKKLRPGEAELPPPALLSARTVAYQHAILHKALQDAIRDEVAGLQRNVLDHVDPPVNLDPRPRRTITPQQASALLVAMAEDPLWAYWLVAFTMGHRRGEALGMRWPDLDLESRIWTPGLSVVRLRGELDAATGKRKGRIVAKQMKTAASLELQAIPRCAAEALGQWRVEQARVRLAAARWASLDLVFTTGLGTAIEPRSVNRAWEALREQAGAPGWVRLHDLRHAFASYLLAGGVNVKLVQRALRHARLATTEVYLHALAEVPREAADKMDEIVGELRKAPRRMAGDA